MKSERAQSALTWTITVAVAALTVTALSLAVSAIFRIDIPVEAFDWGGFAGSALGIIAAVLIATYQFRKEDERLKTQMEGIQRQIESTNRLVERQHERANDALARLVAEAEVVVLKPIWTKSTEIESIWQDDTDRMAGQTRAILSLATDIFPAVKAAIAVAPPESRSSLVEKFKDAQLRVGRLRQGIGRKWTVRSRLEYQAQAALCLADLHALIALARALAVQAPTVHALKGLLARMGGTPPGAMMISDDGSWFERLDVHLHDLVEQLEDKLSSAADSNWPTLRGIVRNARGKTNLVCDPTTKFNQSIATVLDPADEQNRLRGLLTEMQAALMVPREEPIQDPWSPGNAPFSQALELLLQHRPLLERFAASEFAFLADVARLLQLNKIITAIKALESPDQRDLPSNAGLWLEFFQLTNACLRPPTGAHGEAAASKSELDLTRGLLHRLAIGMPLAPDESD